MHPLSLGRKNIAIMEFRRVLVTPSKAKELLEANVANRRPNLNVVAMYAKDMANGKWKTDTGETIKIAKSGRILDGQHRLLAVIKANVPIYFHFAENVDESIFDVLDTGKRRNSTDVFKIEGITHDNVVPSIIVYATELDVHGKTGVTSYKLTNQECLSIYMENPEYWQEVTRKSLNWYKGFAKMLRPSAIGGFYHHFRRLNADMANLFMESLASGIDYPNRTIHLLREKLIADRTAPRRAITPVREAWIIKAWNAYRDGKIAKAIKFEQGREEFPKAR